jgi:hypothetical protein
LPEWSRIPVELNRDRADYRSGIIHSRRQYQQGVHQLPKLGINQMDAQLVAVRKAGDAYRSDPIPSLDVVLGRRIDHSHIGVQ